jgi:hypothetical protein
VRQPLVGLASNTHKAAKRTVLFTMDVELVLGQKKRVDLGVIASQGFNDSYQLTKLIGGHSAHGFLKLPDAALEVFIFVPRLFRHP